MNVNLITFRHRLRLAGYSPIPCTGKKCLMDKWDEQLNATPEEIKQWSGQFPHATNTGVLTRLVPTIDIDILNPEAAKAVEDFVREQHEEHGNILVRFGLRPKRAIPFRTDEPFKKIVANLTAPDGSEGQKIELLADGQQFIVAGIHPDTRKPYGWFGGDLDETPRGNLPYIREDDARALVEGAVELLISDFGYTRAAERPKDRAKANGQGNPGGTADWAYLKANIRAGRELHDSTRDLIAKYITAGMSEGAAVNAVRAEMELCTAPHDAHWQERYDDLPRMAGEWTAKTNCRTEQKKPRVPWTVPLMEWRDSAKIPRRAFIYGYYYARGVLSATIADGGIGKSLLKLIEMLAMVTGLPLLGIKPPERVRALYWNGDDPYVEVERRIHAICKHHEINLKELLDQGWLSIGTSDEQPLCLGEMGCTGLILNNDAVTDICALIKDRGIGLACFDPFKSLHRIPENDNTNMEVIADALKIIGIRTNASVAVDHHIRKPTQGQAEATAADARGASALINKARLSRVCNPMTTQQAITARLKEAERKYYFRADVGKVNITEPEDAVWFKKVPVLCDNGEYTPVVTTWTYPNAFDAVTPEHMHCVREMARTGSYRRDPQANDWIGKAVAEVLDLDPGDEADRKQIKAILKKWFANGVLDTEPRKDKDSKKRPFVVPGNWNEAPKNEVADTKASEP
jgi:hypothetical protein